MHFVFETWTPPNESGISLKRRLRDRSMRLRFKRMTSLRYLFTECIAFSAMGVICEGRWRTFTTEETMGILGE